MMLLFILNKFCSLITMCYLQVLHNIDINNLRYTYSAMSQVVAAILAITLTFRVILSQRLKYRFPLKIVGKLSNRELIYFLLGAVLISLSLSFLTVGFFRGLPILILVMIVWVFALVWYYRVVQNKLSIENLIKEALQEDRKSLQNWKKENGITEPELFLYDLAIQAADQKDFQFMEKVLVCLATLSNIYPSFIINNQIGMICRQYINNTSVFSKCLNIFYRLISPIRVGIWGRPYFFDEIKQPVSLKDTNAYTTQVWFSRSSVYSVQTCLQVKLELEELLGRYFLIYLEEKEQKYRIKEVATIVISALADFLCMKISNPDVVDNIRSFSQCEGNLISFLTYPKKIPIDILSLAAEEVSSRLNSHLGISAKDNVSAMKASKHISKIWCKAAKSLESLLNEKLNKVRNNKESKIQIRILKGKCAKDLNKYWVELPKRTRHNWNCTLLGKTEDGYWTSDSEDLKDTKACDICGG